MTEGSTCGQGLAHTAVVPQLIGDLMNAVADNLVAHVPMLAAGDEATQHERRVYEHLAGRHRDAAAMLQAIAKEMATHQDMPLGQHDFEAMSQAEMVDALQSMVKVEAQLVERLKQHLAEHRAMLDAMAS